MKYNHIILRQALFCLSAVSIILSFTSCSYSSRATKRLLAASEGKQYDMVIVPGTPFKKFKWDRNMKGRVYWAKYLYDRGIAKNLMFSGSSVTSPYYEANIMALYAEKLGVPKEHIYVETKAEHSTENVYYSYYKSKKLGFKTMALASDPFQSKLLRKFVAQKVDPGVAIIPFVIDTMRVLEKNFTNPQIDYKKAFNKDYVSLNQREGFFTRFRGTRGLNIDTTLYR